MKIIKNWFLGAFLALGLGSALYATVVTYFSYGVGFRVGTLAKLSKKGFLFKTYEGELQQGFLEHNPDSGVATRLWTFSVHNEPEVLAQFDEALKKGGHVKVHYVEKLRTLPWVGDTKYLVTHLEILDAPVAPLAPLGNP